MATPGKETLPHTQNVKTCAKLLAVIRARVSCGIQMQVQLVTQPEQVLVNSLMRLKLLENVREMQLVIGMVGLWSLGRECNIIQYHTVTHV